MLILLCFTTYPCWLLFEYACVSSMCFCGHHCHGCERTCKIRSRSCCGMGVFIFFFSNINIVWQKSLSPPLMAWPISLCCQIVSFCVVLSWKCSLFGLVPHSCFGLFAVVVVGFLLGFCPGSFVPIAVTMLLVDYFSCTQNLDLCLVLSASSNILLFAELVSESSVISLDTNSTSLDYLFMCV